MSEQSTGGSSRGEWPPEWVEEAARLGTDPALWASTSGGAVYLAVWRAFGDATPWEHARAADGAPGQDWLPEPSDAVARVRALREARRQWPDLSGDTWQQLVEDVAPRLSERQRQDPGAIIAAVQKKIDATIEVFGPVPEAGRRADKSRRRLRLEAALERCHAGGQRAPTQAEIAEACAPQVAERTLRHWLKDEPGLRDLMPWLRRHGRISGH